MIRLGQYYEGSSFGHCLDARVKIIATLLFSLLIFYARGWNILLISGFLFAVCRVSRLNFIRILEAGKTIIWFALLLFALHIFFTAGSPLCVIPYLNFTITAEGVTRGLLVSWQFVALAYSGIILTMITSPTDLVHGLEFILRPLRHIRVPVSEIALMVSMALRFVPTILEEYDRIKTAQLARGSEMETARYDRRIKIMSALLLPLAVSVFRRAEELAQAMEARNYTGGPRTSFHQQHFGREEIIALFFLGLLVSLVVFIKYRC